MLHRVTSRVDLDRLLTEDHVVVYSGLSWCVPCKRLHPHYEKTAEHFRDSDLTFILVDVDEFDDLDGLEVQSVPTVRGRFGGEDVDLAGRTVLQLTREIEGYLER